MSILVLDIGTTSMRGILYEKNGNKLAVSQKKNHLVFLGDALIEEDPSDWTNNTYAILQEIGKQYPLKDIEAIALTAQRSSVIPVDEAGIPLLPAIMWQDTRNREICDELSVHNEELFQKTGAFVSTVFSGSKMTWIRRNQKEIYKKVYKFLNIPEYICYQMTGRYVSDRTYASRTGLMDLRTGEWDPDILKLYEVDPDKLCELIEPGETAGYITKQFAEKTGVPEGIPVLHCGGDQQCAAIGHGIIREGNASVTVGTGGFITAACDHLPEKLLSGMIWNRSSIPGKFILEANVLSCGAALDWCARELYQMEHPDYDILEKELLRENFVSSCLVVPYFSGKGAPGWDPLARAVFADITTATRRSEIFKSIMESIFMEISNRLKDMEQYVPVRNIYCGGGMTGSDALNQLQADVYGREVFCTKDPEATAFGCLLTALCGMHIYPSIYDAYHALYDPYATRMYQPDMKKHALYKEKRQKMNDLYRRVRKGNQDES